VLEEKEGNLSPFSFFQFFLSRFDHWALTREKESGEEKKRGESERNILPLSLYSFNIIF
jgi:hypothetical protein